MVVASEATGRVRSAGATLALKHGGRWYPAQTRIPDLRRALREDFPHFEDVAFPKPSLEPLE